MTNRPSGDDPLVTVREYLAWPEAEWARNRLASEGICAFLPDAVTGRLYGGLGAALGGVRLQVPRERAAEAEELLEAWEGEEEGAGAPGAYSWDSGEGDATGPTAEGHDAAMDADETCPVAASSQCPACGCPEIEGTDAPDGATGSRTAAWLGLLRGHSWWGCTACGHRWKG